MLIAQREFISSAKSKHKKTDLVKKILSDLRNFGDSDSIICSSMLKIGLRTGVSDIFVWYYMDCQIFKAQKSISLKDIILFCELT